MCGIVGVVSSKIPIEPERLVQMNNALSHRGPDGSGEWVSDDGAVGLAHRRLSIIDLSPLGAQPMLSASGRYAVTYNGEIYNFLELRSELENLGATFRGHSDTEVMLAAFDIWGVVESLPRLRGMFVLAVWDRRDCSLLIARDRVGIKPLYYGAGPRGFAFASELKPLVIWQGELPPVSAAGLTEYLRLGYVPAPLSIFEGVLKLEPGHFAMFSGGNLSSPQPYWRVDEVIEKGRQNPLTGEAEALEALEEVLKKSVASHMVADVPFGAFLSGGVDSSLVVSLMQDLSPRPIKTFSIGFHEKRFNEAKHAAAVAAHLGTEHTELYVSDDDARAVIPLLPEIYDEPFADQSQIPTFLVSKLAREHVTVALSGDGGDEMFAGYNRYVFVDHFWQSLRKWPLPLRKALATGIRALTPDSWDSVFDMLGPVLPQQLRPSLPGQKMHKIASILPSGDLLTLHARLVAQWPSPDSVLQPEWVSNKLHWQKTLASVSGLSDVEQQMAWDAQTYMVDDILTKVDRASMRVGLEARVPLLDHEVIELAWRIPLSLKMRDGGSKWILRQLLYKYVPQHLIDRPKMGFSVPVDEWLRGGIRDWAESAFTPDRLKAEGYFVADAVTKVWNAHLRGDINAGGQLWTLLMFQAWKEKTKTWL